VIALTYGNALKTLSKATFQDLKVSGAAHCSGPPKDTDIGMSTTYEKGVRYELIAKAVFESILKEASEITVQIEHLTKIKGLRTDHEIDILWRFQKAGIQYTTIVQVKNWASKVKQQNILEFKAILDDIPGQPRGVFVSQSGFQRGAENVAKASGIELFQLSPIPKARFTMSEWGWIEFKLNPETLQVESVVYDPRVALKLKTASGANIPPHAFFKSKTMREYSLFDQQGHLLGTLSDVVRELVQLQMSGTRTRTFETPTYVRRQGDACQTQLAELVAEFVVATKRGPIAFALPADFVPFLLTNLQSGEVTTHELAAHISG